MLILYSALHFLLIVFSVSFSLFDSFSLVEGKHGCEAKLLFFVKVWNRYGSFLAKKKFESMDHKESVLHFLSWFIQNPLLHTLRLKYETSIGEDKTPAGILGSRLWVVVQGTVKNGS
jgi:hypothetical protein